MPDDLKITVNFGDLLERISRLPLDIQHEIEMEILDTVMVINGRQKRLAPKDQGGLARNLGYEKIEHALSFTYELFANSEHSGYLEFGTKSKVDQGYISKYGLTAIAQTMIGAGIRTGLTAKEAIFAWCKRNAIAENIWGIIYRSIMLYGIRARHYFFEPFFDEKDKLINRIENLLKLHNL